MRKILKYEKPEITITRFETGEVVMMDDDGDIVSTEYTSSAPEEPSTLPLPSAGGRG